MSLFSLMKKVTKKIKNERQLQFFSGRTAKEHPKKLSSQNPGSSLKKYTVLFINAQPCTVRSRPRPVLKSFSLSANRLYQLLKIQA